METNKEFVTDYSFPLNQTVVDQLKRILADYQNGDTLLIKTAGRDVSLPTFALLKSTERNPFLPEAPDDGRHIFLNGSYRCCRCGVYNREDSPPFHKPCLGNWAESGKMRAYAEDQWEEEKKAKEV